MSCLSLMAACSGASLPERHGDPGARAPARTPRDAGTARATPPEAVVADVAAPSTRIVSLAATAQATCGVASDGRVLCWGLDTEWTEGTTQASSTVPVPVPGIDDAVGVEGSHLTFCVLRRAHPITCWRPAQAPEELRTPWARAPLELDVGGDAVCVRTGAEVRCVGTGTDPARFGAARGVRAIELSNRTMLAISTDGRLLCTGAGVYDPCLRGRDDDDAPLVRVALPGRVTAVGSSGVNTCVALAGGEVRCWGRDVTEYSEAESWHQVPPRVYAELAGAEELVVADRFACARLARGRVVCTVLHQPSAHAVIASGAVELAAGESHACARLDDGSVRCWGDATYGQLGDGSADWIPSPIRVDGVGAARQVLTTPGATYVVARDGRVLGFGGRGPMRGDEVATLAAGARAGWVERVGVVPLDARGRMTLPPAERLPDSARALVTPPARVEQLAVAAEVTCGRDGARVRCEGLLGYRRDGTPYRVRAGDVLFEDVEGFELSPSGLACALLRGGRVRCVGGIASGGNVYPDAEEPAALAGSTRLALGGRAVCGLRPAGELRCAGLGHGALGPDGRVPELPAVVEVALGEHHGCARAADGAVYCFGANASGQLGVGDLRPRVGAVRVPGIEDAVEIDCALARSCARLASGEVACWGDNRQGELGVAPRGGEHAVAVAVRFAR